MIGWRTAALRSVSGKSLAAFKLNAAVLFALTGCMSLLAYAALWLRPLWLGDFDPFAGPAKSLVPILGVTWSGVGRYTVAFLVPVSLYVIALLVLPKVKSAYAWPVSVAVAVLAPLTLLYTYPGLAADVFDYLMSGRLLSEFHVNPYTHSATFAPSDPYYPPVGWKDLSSVYAPGFVLISGAITAICGKSTLAALLAMKATAVAAHLASAALVMLIARRFDRRNALFAFVAYAWNPLVVIHIAVDAHNDSLLLLFLLGAIYFSLDRKWELSFLSLTASALIKFVPLVLFPLFIWEARRDRGAMLLGLGLSALLAIAFYTPFWAGTHTFDGLRDQASRMTTSAASVASFYLPDAWLRPLAVAGFSAGYLLILRSRADILRASYAVLLLYLLVLSFWTKAWYFVWPIALGAAIGGAAFWLSVPGMLGLFASNLIGGWGWQMNWLHWIQRWGLKGMEWALTLSTLGGWLAGLVAVAFTRAGLARAWKSMRSYGPANITE